MTCSISVLSAISLVSWASMAFADARRQPPPPDPNTLPEPAQTAVCYELSANGRAWNKNPELLCVAEESGGRATVTLNFGSSSVPPTAMFQVVLQPRVRCTNCNKDSFAVGNAATSMFNTLTIKFDGKRDLKSGSEAGSISIGKTRFRYRLVQ